ncbi:unnamed protein product [Ostreobium quekettii]|uniref:thiamine phosphate synthase n=1 Tax=Ostreobium quekettii TaxID=121088 RepID=A0A8S1JG75_9CHLO|nr:unnamed protein product [Ostreobium quekettii]
MYLEKHVVQQQVQLAEEVMATGQPTTTGVSLRLWNACHKEVYAALNHPFVQALGAGTLPRATFQRFISQDAHFLEAFACAYAQAMAKVVGSNGPEFEVISELLEGVRAELKMHKTFAEKWGVDLAVASSPSPATVEYCNFLMAVAKGPENVAVVLAAMLPCSQLYGFLGCQLMKIWPEADHDYTEWIKTYAAEEYLELPAKKGKLLDEIADLEDYGKLLKFYKQAMELEVQFFNDHQPFVQSPARNIGVLVVDFDNTLTAGDTVMNLIRAVVAAAAKRLGGTPEEAKQVLQDRMELIEGASGAYQVAFEALLEELISPQVSAVKGKLEFDLEIVSYVCIKLSEFDRLWCQNSIDTGVLKDAGREDVQRTAGRKVMLRDGCLEVLEKARQKGWGVRVLSQSWSAHMIKSVVGDHAEIVEREAETTGDAATIRITANELIYENDITTGDVTRSVECADDKGRAFDDILLDEMSREGRDPHGWSVYIGDAPADILPLLAADFGIVFNKSKAMGDILQALCIQLKPLSAAPLEPTPQGVIPVLYETASWHDIHAFLHGSDDVASIQAAEQPVSVPRVLIVAGSDSGGGAGVQADIKTCLMSGVFGCTAITSLTFQNTKGVQGAYNIPPEAIDAQIDAVLSDIGTHAVKTGMLPSAQAVKVVSQKILEYQIQNLVVDPVLVSTSGHSLAESDVAAAIREDLMPLAKVVTPNIPEAEALLGGRTISNVEDMEAAARDLHAFGSEYVLVKGGHLVSRHEEARSGALEVVDVLFDGKNISHLKQSTITTNNTHGTGCTLASAIAAELAKGSSPLAAVHRAKAYVIDILRKSKGMKTGTGVQQPMNHGATFVDWGLHVGSPSGGGPGDLRLYAVTSSSVNRKWDRSIVDAVSLAISGGASIIQIREKEATTMEFISIAQSVLAVARPQGVKVIINDRVDVALAVDADGVHVGQEDMPAADVRLILGGKKIVGVSARSVEQAVKAQKDGADYIGAGAVFPTSTKESDAIGLECLHDICTAVSVPVVAIGGVSAENALSTIDAGCKGVAVVSSLFDSDDPETVGQELLAVVEQGLKMRKSP